MQCTCMLTMSCAHKTGTSYVRLRASVPVGLMGYSVLLDAHLISDVHLKGLQSGLKSYAGT